MTVKVSEQKQELIEIAEKNLGNSILQTIISNP